MDKILHEIVDTIVAFVVSLVPSALGATVSMMVDEGITWSKMLARLWVGIVVSYFTSRALDALFELHPFVIQAISFLIGMVAYKSAPGFIAGCATALGEAPGLIRDRLLVFLPSKSSKEKK
jgi:putative Mn2+ efflux pump MntP